MDSAQLKRMILEQSDSTGIRKRVLQNAGDVGLTNDDVIDIGKSLDDLTNLKGWAYIEAYIMKSANPLGLLFGQEDPIAKGKARGLIELMQYVDQMIKAKNELLKKANEDKTNS